MKIQIGTAMEAEQIWPGGQDTGLFAEDHRLNLLHSAG
jgi:hypothetical protein